MCPSVDGVVSAALDIPDNQIFFRTKVVILTGEVEEGDVDGEERIANLRRLQSHSFKNIDLLIKLK